MKSKEDVELKGKNLVRFFQHEGESILLNDTWLVPKKRPDYLVDKSLLRITRPKN